MTRQALFSNIKYRLLEFLFIYVVVVVLHFLFSAPEYDARTFFVLPLTPLSIFCLVSMIVNYIDKITDRINIKHVIGMIAVYVFLFFIGPGKDSQMNRLNDAIRLEQLQNQRDEQMDPQSNSETAPHSMLTEQVSPTESTVSVINDRKALSEKFLQLEKDIDAANLSDELLAQLDDLARQLVVLSFAGDWEGFLALVKNNQGFEVPQDELVATAIAPALMNTAPMNVIDEMLSMGGELVLSHRPIAFFRGDFEYVSDLVDRGLPLHGYDGAHSSITGLLSYTGTSGDGRLLKLFDYLLDSGCDVNIKDIDGHSAMHYVLNGLTTNQDTFYFARELLVRDIQLTTSDIRKLTLMKSREPTSFYTLTTAVPEFLDYLE